MNAYGNSMNNIRRHLIFQGYVQGVGFRYRAYHNARSLGITGWVRNLDDGSVEMEAEGSPQAIWELIEALDRNMWAQIDNLISEEIPVQGGYSFEIL